MLTMVVLMAATVGAPPIAEQGRAAARSIVAEIQAELPQRAALLAVAELPLPISDRPLVHVVQETVGAPPAGGLNE